VTEDYIGLLVGDDNGLIGRSEADFKDSPAYYERVRLVRAEKLDAAYERIAELEKDRERFRHVVERMLVQEFIDLPEDFGVARESIDSAMKGGSNA
jgi:hypothetical protein